jgi:hypothetical protein
VFVGVAVIAAVANPVPTNAAMNPNVRIAFFITLPFLWLHLTRIDARRPTFLRKRQNV